MDLNNPVVAAQTIEFMIDFIRRRIQMHPNNDELVQMLNSVFQAGPMCHNCYVLVPDEARVAVQYTAMIATLLQYLQEYHDELLDSVTLTLCTSKLQHAYTTFYSEQTFSMCL